MKKWVFGLRAAGITAALLLGCTLFAGADTAYKTITVDRNGRYVETQTAYRPVESFSKIGEETLNAPADLAIQDGRMYICDTGNARVVVSDLGGELVTVLGAGILAEPTGIALADDGTLYVADKGLGKVLALSSQGEVLREYARPQEPLYGKSSTFTPIKVAVDSKDNLFVVSEGNTNGIVQLSRSSGEFLGYFGANKTDASLWRIISDVIFTEEQKNQIRKNVPTSVNNLAIDSLGMIYTVTDVDTAEVIRKLNMSGNNVIQNTVTFQNPTDITVGGIGNIYACTKDGYILEFNSEGQLLFLFCGLDDGSQRIGLFSSISSIALDDSGRLFVLDDGKNEIQVFETTEFADNVHTALDLYQSGRYLQSREPWENVLRMNNLFDYANQGIGYAYYKAEEYTASMHAFRLANSTEGYSDAFAEQRNLWLKANFVWLVAILIGVILLWKLVRLIQRKTVWLRPVEAAIGRVGRVPLVSQLRFLLTEPRNPAAANYGIKREGKTSPLSATILYGVFAVLFLLEKYASGFLFKSVEDGQYTIFSDVAILLGVFLLLNLCHYLICSITGGEASIRDVYQGLIYSMMPYFVLKPVTILLSHALTYNERFLMTLLQVVIYSGCVILLFVMVREMNNYTIGETVKNILLTLFFLLVAVATLFVLYILAKQFIGFVGEFFNEVRYRVKN